MFTTKEIWEAGRAALGLAPAAATRAAAPGPAQLAALAEEDNASSVFDASAFAFEPRTYRIHFKNGCSGEYEGAALATSFPFDPSQIERIEPVEEVGQDL
jgi:hypothetical protein